jgi:hypothetical protein
MTVIRFPALVMRSRVAAAAIAEPEILADPHATR